MRPFGQCIAIPDQRRMYFEGGFTGSEINRTFEEFSVDENGQGKWSLLPEFSKKEIPNSSIIRGHVAYVTAINKLVFYGGSTEVPVNQTAVLDGNVITTFSDKDDMLPFGFDKLTTFDSETQEWEEVTNLTGKPNDNFIYSNTLISPPGSNVMYSIGGYEILRNDTSASSHWVGFNVLYKITFPDYSWETLNCNSRPIVRDFYTTTFLPDGKTILMYGGASYSDWVALDNSRQVCYVLDLESYEWRSCNLPMIDGADLFRYHHSAVLVKNHLFILFGFENPYSTISSILILDVSNSSNIQYVPEYNYLQPIPIPTNPSEKITTDPPGNKGLSTGGIAGIAVGCIALVK
ncbi:hypothetical protein BDB01DRAFT_377228 [Pilobolus umbonatus]|nr:hypothetical protein BDB01DRAFT_377228 [Pilobolus umbonatus]